eukprot:3475-Chlamydomonas_euryale.AAC.1
MSRPRTEAPASSPPPGTGRAARRAAQRTLATGCKGEPPAQGCGTWHGAALALSNHTWMRSL